MLSEQDVKGVEMTLAGLGEAWNTHDMAAYEALLTEDCEWVNVVGMYWPNRAAVAKAHRAFHATMFKDVGVRELEHHISEVAPGVACVVLTLAVDEYTTPDGRRMTGIQDRMTYMMVKRGGQWLVRLGHNSTIDARAAAHDPGK